MQQVTNVRNAVGGLPRRAQVAIVGVILITIVLLFLVVRAATHTEWMTVAADMRPEQASEAQKALEKEGIESQLAAGATGIQVPADHSSQARATLASAGIKMGAGGHTSCEDAFSKGTSSFTAATSQQMAVKLQTCLQNEISNAVEAIDGIESARTQLVMPSTELFSAEQNPATAAITIDTAGASLEEGQVRAITRLAANSVKNLKPADVMIIDESGKLLNEDTAGGGGSLTELQAKLKVERLFNQQTEAELTQKLEKLVGAGNVTVMSNAELDVDKVREEARDFGGEENAQGPIDARDSKDERLDNGGETPGGVTGTGGNAGRDSEDNRIAEDTEGDDGSDYRGTDDKITYSNDMVARLVEKAPGTVKRHRISVAVDDSVPAGTAAAVKNQVSAFMGGNAEDSYSFDQVPMPEPENMDGEAAAAARWDNLSNYIKWGVLGLGMIGLAFFLRRSLERREDELLNPAEDLLLLDSGFDPVPLKELEAAVTAASNLDSHKRGELQRKVERIALERPSDVAQQLRGWLHEEEYQQSQSRRKGA